MTAKAAKAIEKEFKTAVFKAAEKAIKKLDKLPTDKKTVSAAYDVLGGIGSMMDPWTVPKEYFKVEKKFEDIPL